MKERTLVGHVCLCLFAAAVVSGAPAMAQVTNSVTAGATSFHFDGGPANPPITLQRGVTYVFNVNTFGHPFYIKTAQTDGSGNAYNNGVVNNGTSGGVLRFAVPTNAPSQLFYVCALHASFGMRGTITIEDPPAPPTGEIVLVTLSPTGVTMKSLGAAGWSASPEYASNAVSGVWATVPGFSNSYENGTNTMTFDRLEPICGPNVFLRVRNSR